MTAAPGCEGQPGAAWRCHWPLKALPRKGATTELTPQALQRGVTTSYNQEPGGAAAGP